MTTISECTRKNQLTIQIIELENQLSERNAEKAAKGLVANAKIAELAKQFDEVLLAKLAKEEKLKKRIAEYRQSQKYVDTGQLVFAEMKDEIRRLSCQVEGNDLDYNLLNMQLSAFTDADDIKYLNILAGQLRKRRSFIFKTGRIDPDAVEDSDGKRGYELGKKIGKSVIPIH